MKSDLLADIGNTKNVFGSHPLIIHQRTRNFSHLSNFIVDKYPSLRNVNILSIVIGDSDCLYDELATSYSVYNGCDGHDNVKDGYRNILKGIVHGYEFDVQAMILRRLNCITQHNWLVICDVGIGFIDLNTRMPQIVKWCEFPEIRIKNRSLELFIGGCCAHIKFGDCAFVERIARGIARMLEIVNNEQRTEIEEIV